MSDSRRDYEECREAAISAGALEPQGLVEGMAANVLECQGQSFANTLVAQNRLKAWIEDCMRRKGYSD